MKPLVRCFSNSYLCILRSDKLTEECHGDGGPDLIWETLCRRPKLTWKKLTEKDCSEWKLTTVDTQERSTWRSGVRSAMHAASQLLGRGPTVVDVAPAPAR